MVRFGGCLDDRFKGRAEIRLGGGDGESRHRVLGVAERGKVLKVGDFGGAAGLELVDRGLGGGGVQIVELNVAQSVECANGVGEGLEAEVGAAVGEGVGLFEQGCGGVKNAGDGLSISRLGGGLFLGLCLGKLLLGLGQIEQRFILAGLDETPLGLGCFGTIGVVGDDGVEQGRGL